MKIELAVGAAKKAVANQGGAAKEMIARVVEMLDAGDVKQAYSDMNYDLMKAFMENLESLVNEIG